MSTANFITPTTTVAEFLSRRTLGRIAAALALEPALVTGEPVASTKVRGKLVTVFAVRIGAAERQFFHPVADRVGRAYASAEAALASLAPAVRAVA